MGDPPWKCPVGLLAYLLACLTEISRGVQVAYIIYVPFTIYHLQYNSFRPFLPSISYLDHDVIALHASCPWQRPTSLPPCIPTILYTALVAIECTESMPDALLVPQMGDPL